MMIKIRINKKSELIRSCNVVFPEGLAVETVKDFALHMVNGVLKSLLATTENRNKTGGAAGQEQKKR